MISSYQTCGHVVIRGCRGCGGRQSCEAKVGESHESLQLRVQADDDVTKERPPCESQAEAQVRGHANHQDLPPDQLGIGGNKTSENHDQADAQQSYQSTLMPLSIQDQKGQA